MAGQQPPESRCRFGTLLVAGKMKGMRLWSRKQAHVGVDTGNMVGTGHCWGGHWSLRCGTLLCTIRDLTLANSLPFVIQFCYRDKGVDRKSKETGPG